MIFIQVSQTLVQAGFNQALIQKKDTDEEDYSSVFWINLTVSIVIYGILFISAPWIADFYEQPVLAILTRTFSLVFVINAFSYVQEARMSKEMRFKTLTIIHIPSTILGGIVSIVMALLGYGVWSIIALQIVTRFSYAVQIWLYSRWKPLFSFNRKKAKKLFSFGSRLMISGVIDTLYQNIFIVIIGRFFPVSSVGYYQNANNLVRMPSSTFSSALVKVAFPAFSSIQDDDERIKKGYKTIMQQVLFWLCPAFVLVAVLAVPLFRFVFTEKWLPAVPYFRILCLVGILFPLQVYNLNIIKVKGRADLFLRLSIIKYVIMSIGLIIIIPYGIWALLFMQAASSMLAVILNSYYSGKLIRYAISEQLIDILPIFLLSLVVGALVFILNDFLVSFPDSIRVIIGLAFGSGIYIISARVIKLQPYIDFFEIWTNMINKRFSKFNQA